MKEKEPLAETPEGRGAEFIGTGGSPRNAVS
jgi:hypothetical protein